MKFSSSSLNPPIDSNKKAQFTNPVNFSKPEFHDKSESRGLCILKFELRAKLVPPSLALTPNDHTFIPSTEKSFIGFYLIAFPRTWNPAPVRKKRFLYLN